MTPPKLITKRYHWRTWKQQFKPKPFSIHCMIGNVDTRFRQWTFVPYFKQKKPKVANGEVTQDYLGELENIEKRAYYTRDVYILGQFVNVQKSFFAFGFTKGVSYVDKLKVLFIIIEQINTNNDQAKPKQKKNNG